MCCSEAGGLTVAVIIGLVKVTAALMSVDSHTPVAVCSNSPNIRHGMNVFLFFFSLPCKYTHTHTCVCAHTHKCVM